MQPGKFGNCETLGDYAYQAIQKHFKKSIKHEADVLKGDPEALHQMRVGMRRLRTALLVFESALVLPKKANAKYIRKIAGILGHLRDLDVMRAELKDRYHPTLKGKEQRKLENVLDHLHQHHSERSVHVNKTLDGKAYGNFKEAFSNWLKEPQFGAIAALPILVVLPDLLLPLISQMFLNPGWFVGVHFEHGGWKPSTQADPKSLQKFLDDQGEVLHDLRKQMKQVRYQAEFFTPFYGEAFQTRVEEFQAIQEILGRLHDYTILNDFIKTAAGSQWQQDLPTLVDQSQQTQFSAWDEWRSMQQQYLDLQFRADLRQLVANPQAIDRASEVNESASEPESDRIVVEEHLTPEQHKVSAERRIPMD